MQNKTSYEICISKINLPLSVTVTIMTVRASHVVRSNDETVISGPASTHNRV